MLLYMLCAIWWCSHGLSTFDAKSLAFALRHIYIQIHIFYILYAYKNIIYNQSRDHIHIYIKIYILSQQTRIHSKTRNLKIWSFDQSRVQEQHAYLSIGFLVFSPSSLLNLSLSFSCVFLSICDSPLAGYIVYNLNIRIVVTTK